MKVNIFSCGTPDKSGRTPRTNGKTNCSIDTLLLHHQFVESPHRDKLTKIKSGRAWEGCGIRPPVDVGVVVQMNDLWCMVEWSKSNRWFVATKTEYQL